MRPIDVIHIFEDVGNVKWDDTYSLAESLLIKVFVRSTYDFPFFGWGAAPFITTETKLCQSLIPHAKFVILNKRVGLFVNMTSTTKRWGCVFSKTCCLFYQATQVKYITYICQRLAFVWRAHIVVEIAYDNEVVKMNEQFINVRREVVGERGVCHRWGSVGTHKCPLPATNRSFNDNALNVCEL